MPLPRVNETWRERSTGIERIVAVADHLTRKYLLVSKLGERLEITDAQMVLEWSRAAPAPACRQACSRYGCNRDAFLLYRRPPPSEQDEVVCPVHAPIGLLCELLRRARPDAVFTFGDSCTRCSSDATEVFSPHTEGSPETISLWHCHRCSRWWMRVHSLSSVADSLKLEAFVPRGFAAIEDSVSGDGWTIDLTRTPVSNVLTIYEYALSQVTVS